MAGVGRERRVVRNDGRVVVEVSNTSGTKIRAPGKRHGSERQMMRDCGVFVSDSSGIVGKSCEVSWATYSAR